MCGGDVLLSFYGRSTLVPHLSLVESISTAGVFVSETYDISLYRRSFLRLQGHTTFTSLCTCSPLHLVYMYTSTYRRIRPYTYNRL